MKRFFSSSFIALALIISAVGVHAPVAHADAASDYAACVAGCNTNGYTDACGSACLANYNTAVGTSFDPNAGAAAATPTTLPATPSSITSGFSTIMTWIMNLFAWLVGAAALTLDYAVYYTVITMGNYVSHLTAVGVTWRILRDIGNIVLIFGFLAIGITTILDVKWYGGGFKMLPMLLVAAVFLNFSLFFSEAVIDVGNLFATQFYTQINGGQPLANLTVANEPISNKIMAQVGLQNIYQTGNTEIFKAGNTWVIGFMAIILFIVTAFVMFSLAFILIARFVILLFLIIIAPIGFAGLAIPQLKSSADRWWHLLFEQTITAPVLLLLLYVALAVITDASFLTGFGAGANSGGWTGWTGTNNLTGLASMLLSFIVAMGLLFAVVIISKRLSAFGAAGATKLASKLSGASLAAAAPGWVGRYTVGLGANYAAKKLRDTKFGHSFVGRGFADTLEKKVAGASFDVRNTSLGKSAEGLGLDLGKGQKGGYKADLEERVKSYERAAAGITGGVEEKKEKEKAKLARANLETATQSRDKAVIEHGSVSPALQQERDSRNAEVERLKKDKEKAGIGTFRANEIDKELIPAQKSLEESEVALKAANEKLINAETARAKAMSTETEARKSVGTAKKQAQNEYADRLENKWGPVWVFGTAAAAAAPRVRSNIGKTSDQRAIEALLKDIKDKSGGSEGGGRAGAGEKKEEKG